ncbi:MAG: hypothetical protein WBP55_06585 [Solirubrobacterales bacterium]
MKSLKLSVLATLMLVAVFFIAPASANAHRPLTTGVTTPDIELAPQIGYDRIKSAGASFTRVILFWRDIAPADEPVAWDPTDPNDPNYNWAGYDLAIERAGEAGVEVLASIYQAPEWAERCKSEVEGICNPDPQAFADFTEAAATRYSGQSEDLPRIKYWKPWNEPNLFISFLPQFKNGKAVSPKLYRNLLNGFAERVKAVNSNNQVVGGGLAPLERPGSLGPLDFQRQVLCLKGRNKPRPQNGCGQKAMFDIWATNPFTTGGPTHASAGRDDASLGDLGKVKTILKAAKKYKKVITDKSSVPFWVTEFSWDSKGPDPGGVKMNILKKWVPEAMYTAWKAGVTRFSWLSLRDWSREKGAPYSETFESGLYFRASSIENDKAKPFLKSFRFPFVAYRGGSGIRVWGRTASSLNGRVAIYYKLRGGFQKIKVMKTDKNGIFTGLIRTGKGKKNKGVLKAKVIGGAASKVGGQQGSLNFSLKPIKDFRQAPFGNPVS